MKFGCLFLLCAGAALTGCSSSSSGSSATPSPTAVVASRDSTATPTSGGQPTTSSSQFQQGSQYLKLRNFGAAESSFRAAIVAHDRPAMSYAGLGAAAFGLGDFMSAFKAFKNASALSPFNPTYDYQAAVCAFYAADWHGAIDYATRYLRLRPRDYNGYHLRFLAESRLTYRQPAVQDAIAEVSLQPRNSDAYDDLGIAYGNAGKYRKSEHYLTQAIRMRPGVFDYYRNRAFVENLDHKQSAALADMQTALKLAPTAQDRKNVADAIRHLKNYMASH